MRFILSENIIKNYGYGTNFFKIVKLVNLFFLEKNRHFWDIFQNFDFENFFSCYGIEIFKKFFFVDNEEKCVDFQDISKIFS